MIVKNYNSKDLFLGIEKFFDAIKSKCSGDKEYAAEILKSRGFLLEDDGLILSDNSHKADANYLNELLTEENLGEVTGNKIIIFPNADVEKIFYSNILAGSESFLAREITWDRFLNESFAPKIPVVMLEKFVARYIKAISACGVQTHGSCDGNHHTQKKYLRIYIEISSQPNIFWHKIICQRLVVNRFNLNFNKTYDKIIKGKSRNMIKKFSADELAEEFFKIANKLFDEFYL